MKCKCVKYKTQNGKKELCKYSQTQRKGEDMYRTNDWFSEGFAFDWNNLKATMSLINDSEMEKNIISTNGNFFRGIMSYM